MAKLRLDVVLEPDKLEYLNTFGPRAKSKIVSEALELHKNKDKQAEIKKDVPQVEKKIVSEVRIRL